MGCLMADEQALPVVLDPPDDRDECEVIPIRPERESLSENFIDELEAWARHTLAANGFGDY